MSHDVVLKTPHFAGRVERYHAWPVLRKQTVGEHTWQCLRIYIQIFGNPPPTTATYLVFHDAGELVLGDLPYPVKRDNPALKKACNAVEVKGLAGMGVTLPKLSLKEKARCKLCDCIEMLETGLIEYNMGNRWAAPIAVAMEERVEAVKWALSAAERRKVDKYLLRFFEVLTELRQAFAVRDDSRGGKG